MNYLCIVENMFLIMLIMKLLHYFQHMKYCRESLMRMICNNKFIINVYYNCNVLYYHLKFLNGIKI